MPVTLHHHALHTDIRRHFLPAFIQSFRASACEFASTSQVLFVLPLGELDRRSPLLPGVRCRYGFAKEPGMWVLGLGQDLLYQTCFYDVPSKHDGNPVTDVVGSCQVVSNVDHCHPELVS